MLVTSEEVQLKQGMPYSGYQNAQRQKKSVTIFPMEDRDVIYLFTEKNINHFSIAYLVFPLV